MSLSLVGQSANDGSSITAMPAHQIGDLIVVFATRGNSTTNPSLPSGYNALGTNTATTSSYRSGYKIATSTSETGGAWSGATQIMVLVFRGQKKVQVPINHHGGQSGSSSPTVNFSGITTMQEPSSSMVLSLACIVSLDTSLETARTNSTNIANFVGNTMELSAHISNTAPASWVFNGQSVGGTTGAYMTATIEILVDDGDIELRQSSISATNSSSTTATYPIAPIAGNLLVAWAYTNGNISTLDISGWTKQTNAGLNYSGTAQSVQMFTKVADGSETTVTSTGNTICRLHIAEFSNVDTTIFQTDGANNNATSTTTTVQTGSISTTNNDDLLLVIAGTSTGETGTRNWNDSFTVMRDDSASPRLLSGYRVVNSTGTFNPTATIGSTSTNSGAAILAIKKAGVTKLPFFEDFEGGIPGDFDSVGNQWGSPTGTLDTTSKIEGTNSVYFNSTGEGHASAQVDILENKSELYIQFKGFIPSGQTWGAGNYAGLLQIIDSSDGELVRFNIDNYSVAGHVRLSAYTAATGYIDTGIDIPEGQVFILEIRVKLNASTGVISAWLDNNVEASPDYTSGSVNTGAGLMRKVRLGVFYIPQATLGYYVDDVAIETAYMGFESSGPEIDETDINFILTGEDTDQNDISFNLIGELVDTTDIGFKLEGIAGDSEDINFLISGQDSDSEDVNFKLSGILGDQEDINYILHGQDSLESDVGFKLEGFNGSSYNVNFVLSGQDVDSLDLSFKLEGFEPPYVEFGFKLEGKAGLSEFKIVNNLIVDSDRELWLPEIFAGLEGTEFYPFTAKSTGLGYLEIGDQITVSDRYDNEYDSIILSSEISIGTGFSEDFKTPIPNKTSTNYNNAGIIGQRITNTEIRVNKQDALIELINTSLTTNYFTRDETTAQIVLATDSIISSVESISSQLTTVANQNDTNSEAITLIQADITEIEQSATEINLKVERTGGVNLLKNSVGLRGDVRDWQIFDINGVLLDADNDATIDQSTEVANNTESNSAIKLEEQYILQTVNTIEGEVYTFYCRYQSLLTCDLSITGVDGVIEMAQADEWTVFKYEFTATGPTTTIRLDNTTAGSGAYIIISDTVFKIGVVNGWVQAPNEVYGTGFRFDKDGLRLTNVNSNFEVLITNESFTVYDISGGIDRIMMQVSKDNGKITNLIAQNEFVIRRYENSEKSARFIPTETGMMLVIND